MMAAVDITVEKSYTMMVMWCDGCMRGCELVSCDVLCVTKRDEALCASRWLRRRLLFVFLVRACGGGALWRVGGKLGADGV
jgi:hypothetical protein